MIEKSNLEILCDEKIPALLNRVPPKEVFEDYAQSSPKYTKDELEKRFRYIESEEAQEARL